MPLEKVGLLALVRREAKDADERIKLLFLATDQWEQWKGLQEHEAMGVLRGKLAKPASGGNCSPHVPQTGSVGRGYDVHT